MEFDYERNIIRLEKESNSLDELTLDFTSILERLDIKYVVVSGYVSILFGRNRSSEDIDIIMKKITFRHFQRLWSAMRRNFECLNTGDSKEAFAEYLMTGHALRFSRKKRFIPMIELKFPKIGLEAWALKQRKLVVVNKRKVFISPLELQIAFKLYLGSEKDIEDAKHLYELFKERINLLMLYELNQKLKVERLFNKYLR